MCYFLTDSTQVPRSSSLFKVSVILSVHMERLPDRYSESPPWLIKLTRHNCIQKSNTSPLSTLRLEGPSRRKLFQFYIDERGCVSGRGGGGNAGAGRAIEALLTLVGQKGFCKRRNK